MISIARWSLIGMFVVSAFCFAFALGYALNNDSGSSKSSSSAGAQSNDKPFDVLNAIYDVLRRDFIDGERLQNDVDRQLLLEAAVQGMLKSLGDPHTVYIDPDSFRAGRADASGHFEGIGANVRQDTQSGRIVIVTPFTGSPAEQAGIKAGDIILAVDGESTDGWTVDRAVVRIRGPKGTPVRIRVRHTDGKEQEFEIKRDEIVIGTVFVCPEVPLATNGSSTRGLDVACPLKDANGNEVPDLAYIHIEQFTESTADDLQSALKAIAPKKPRGLILDMRGNPGGLLDATVSSADLFLDRGTVLIQEGRNGSRREYRARDGKEIDVPMVVLMDSGSASGAEVLAAALRDNGRAIIIGQKSFGKGTVNQLRPLPDGGAIYVSVARWLTPKGAQIEGTGVIPDIEVIPTDEDLDKAARNRDWDPQLFRAMQELRRTR